MTKLATVAILVLLVLAPQMRGQTVTGTHHRATPAGVSAGDTGELQSFELTANGENYFSWRASDAMAATNRYVMPIAFPGATGFVLSSTMAGLTSWVAQTSGGPAGGSLSGTYPNPALAATQPDAHTWNGLPKFTANLIIGSAGMVVPASAVDNLVLEGGTAPSANPATSGVSLWADTTLGPSYRSGVTNEGAGLTHALHNRFVEQYGTGTSYTFTASSALINFGTNDAQVTVPSAGTWLLNGSITVLLSPSSSFATSRAITIRFRRTNNTPADLQSSDGVDCRLLHNTGIVATIAAENLSMYDATFSCIYTTTNNNDIIAMYGLVNTLPDTGTLVAAAAGSYLQAVRLF